MTDTHPKAGVSLIPFNCKTGQVYNDYTFDLDVFESLKDGLKASVEFRLSSCQDVDAFLSKCYFSAVITCDETWYNESGYAIAQFIMMSI